MGESAPVCRIDTDAGKPNALDDLAITGELIEMVRLERMDTGHFWGRIYMRDGSAVELAFWVEKRVLRAQVEHL